MRVVKEAEERKSEILDVAEKLFAEKGFDNTSTNDIIKVVGIARGTLYHHFDSKEAILDALIRRIERTVIADATRISHDKSIPILMRITQTIMALNVESKIGHEVMAQVHKPQNALMHQKLQERLISQVVPIISDIVVEGIEEGIFKTPFPYEASEMLMIYSNIAFDDLAELTQEEQMQKLIAFTFNAERILGTDEGALKEAIMPIFGC